MSHFRLLPSLLLLLSAPAFAADSTVSSMTAASALNGAELYYCVQGGADRKCTGTQLQTFINTFPMTIVGGTSGGIPYFSSTTALSSSAALTANNPVIGGGAGVAPTVGSRSGNTTTFATTSGVLTSGNCAKFDASGNIVDNGATCGGGGGGSGTVNSGTAGQFAYYPASAAAVSGNANFTISGSDLTAGVAGSAVGTLSFGNATSGTIKLSPATGALGTSVITLPATTGTMTVLGNTATGSGSVVLATSPALTTPNLGTPSTVTLTNATGLPVATGISGLGTGVATSLAANIAAAADVQAGTSTSKLVVPSALSGAAAVQTLTDGATVNWDMAAGYNAKVTLGGNRTMAAPTNVQAGITYTLQVIQDGTGSRTVTWNGAFLWGANGAPTLSTAAGKIDIVTCFASAATPTLLCNYTLGF